MSHIIVGFGEVGQGLKSVIPEAAVYDLNLAFEQSRDAYEYMHICFPHSDRFAEQVTEYFYKFHPRLTIIHSTVPVGTTERLGPHVVHSPIRGVHPNLGAGIKTFVKYFGGRAAREAAKVFEDLGVQTRCTQDSRTTEALKLWDTTQYGIQIVLMKEIHRWCEAHGVDFDLIYNEANQDYNKGYLALGRPEVVRPSLSYTPGQIGGHCVLPNCRLLPDSPIAEFILAQNSTY